MADRVQLLWFEQERENDEDIELLIGIYRTEKDAHEAVERLRGKAGFLDFPDGFKIVSYELNMDHWTEGFGINSPSSDQRD